MRFSNAITSKARHSIQIINLCLNAPLFFMLFELFYNEMYYLYCLTLILPSSTVWNMDSTSNVVTIILPLHPFIKGYEIILLDRIISLSLSTEQIQNAEQYSQWLWSYGLNTKSLLIG